MLKSGKNYYEILGVSTDADLVQLKSAYRSLVRKYHPDVNPSGEALFKSITEAYDVLSDAKLRSQYDIINGIFKTTKEDSKEEVKNHDDVYRKTFRKSTEPSFDSKGSSSSPKPKQENSKSDKQIADMINDIIDGFSKKKSAKAKKSKPAPKKGADVYANVEITFKESVVGTHKVVNIVHTTLCEKCEGRKFINGSVCPNCLGHGEIKMHQKINITIPPNVKDGTKLRLRGEGKKGSNGGDNGDLYLKISVIPDSLFKVDGNDLICELSISPFDAVLGAELKIQSIDGDVMLKIPEFTKSGQVFRIAGQGLKKNNLVGDIIVTVRIQIPDKISDEEIILYKKLKELSGANHRENLK